MDSINTIDQLATIIVEENDINLNNFEAVCDLAVEVLEALEAYNTELEEIDDISDELEATYNEVVGTVTAQQVAEYIADRN